MLVPAQRTRQETRNGMGSVKNTPYFSSRKFFYIPRLIISDDRICIIHVDMRALWMPAPDRKSGFRKSAED